MLDQIKKTSQVINDIGFTLIELMIVLVITSLLVALALPNFNRILGGYQLDISAREMISDIRDLQQAAVKTQISTYSVMWNTETETYYLRNTGTTSYKTVILPSSVDLVNVPMTDDLPQLGFAKSGRPNNGFGGTVKLMDKNTGKNKYVIIDTLGRVRISDTF